MNKLLRIGVSILLSFFALVGCSAAAKTIASKTQNERPDVFKEVKGSEPIPAGFADVIIKASIKTHLEGYYIGESKESAHGKPDYPYLINIDGQSAAWHVTGVTDSKPSYDKDGKTSLDPEAREGMKYVLEKKVRLAAGQHKVFFGLSEETYYTVTEISVKEGGSYVLEFKPVYNYKTSPTRIPTFLKGINRYEIVLNESAGGGLNE